MPKPFEQLFPFHARLSTTPAHPPTRLPARPPTRPQDRVHTFLEKCPDSAAKLSVSAALQRLGGLGFAAQAKAKATAKLMQGMDGEVRAGAWHVGLKWI